MLLHEPAAAQNECNKIHDVVMNELGLDCFYVKQYQMVLVRIDPTTIDSEVFQLNE